MVVIPKLRQGFEETNLFQLISRRILIMQRNAATGKNQIAK